MAFYTFVPMAFAFYKYQGTGNDFIIIDNREFIFPKNNTKLVAQLCDRKFGIGADGLILFEEHESLDFKMVYYNADGALGSFCGNGARCITHFANFLGVVKNKTTFEAADGTHFSTINNGIVSLRLNDVDDIKQFENHYFLNTGSPHHVELVKDLATYDVVGKGRTIRQNMYPEAGSNVNFVEAVGNDIFSVRTYERGVEDETFSCGTGVTAVAVAMAHKGIVSSEEVTIKTLGGDLKVTFSKKGSQYTDIHLVGPAVQVFKGSWE